MRGARGAWVAGVVLLACGGSLTTIDADSGSDSSLPPANDASGIVDSPIGHVDVAPPPDAGTCNGVAQYDGTVGKPCTSDDDCASTNGPCQARCSTTVFQGQPYNPTPVCVLPSCKPVHDGAAHFCDGPDDPSSPGICIDQGQGNGICIPRCIFHDDGKPPVGCAGKNVCNVYSYAQGPTGYGYCFGGCLKDSDCPSGSQCAAVYGYCFTQSFNPTKNVGDACTQADQQNGACNCFLGQQQKGYCSTFCITGQNSCPGGWTCEGFESKQAGFSKVNPGLGGLCAPGCAGVDAATCPGGSSCTAVFVDGPDCIP